MFIILPFIFLSFFKYLINRDLKANIINLSWGYYLSVTVIILNSLKLNNLYQCNIIDSIL